MQSAYVIPAPETDPVEQITNTLHQELKGLFHVTSVNARSQGNVIIFGGRLLVHADSGYDEIRRRFQAHGSPSCADPLGRTPDADIAETFGGRHVPNHQQSCSARPVPVPVPVPVPESSPTTRLGSTEVVASPIRSDVVAGFTPASASLASNAPPWSLADKWAPQQGWADVFLVKLDALIPESDTPFCSGGVYPRLSAQATRVSYCFSPGRRP